MTASPDTLTNRVAELEQQLSALRASSQHLSMLADHIDAVFWIVSPDTRQVLYTSPGYEKIWGRPSLNRIDGPGSMLEAVHPDDRPTLVAAMQRRARQETRGNTEIEYRIIRPDQSVRWIHSRTIPVVDEQGQVVQLTGIAQDITQRKLAEQALRDANEQTQLAQEYLRQAHGQLERSVSERTAELAHSEEKWRSLVETAPDLILLLDRAGNIRFINRVRQDFEREAVIGRSAFDFIRPEFRAPMRASIDEVLRNGSFQTYESAVDGQDGSTTWYASRVGPFREQGETTGVVVIATDITRAKEAEENLKSDERLLRQLLEIQEKERLMVAHDIHDGFVQHVVAAYCHLQAIQEQAEPQATRNKIEEVERLLQKAIAEGRRLMRDLRPMGLGEEGIVAAIEHMVADEQKHAGLEVAFEHTVQFHRLESRLEGAIFRIIQEALTNVKRHSQTRQATVQLTQLGGVLHITVRDQGCGFHPRNVSPECFGLRGMIERSRLFGGEARVESSPGEGTVVTVHLPLPAQGDSELPNK